MKNLYFGLRNLYVLTRRIMIHSVSCLQSNDLVGVWSCSYNTCILRKQLAICATQDLPSE